MDTRGLVRDFVLRNCMYGADASELQDGMSFLGTGIMDSTGVMEMIAFLEETFEIQVEDHEFLPENLDSVDNTCRYLARKCSAGATVAGESGGS